MQFKLKENPYGIWDNGINPKYFLWEKERKPVSQLNDERSFSLEIIDFLKKEAVLIEDYNTIAEKKLLTDEDDDLGFLYGRPGSNSSLFLYKNNLISVSKKDQTTVELNYFYAVGDMAQNQDFERWVSIEKGQSKVSILVSQGGSLTSKKVSFSPPVMGDLELNYGTGFNKVHNKIIDKLASKKAGLILMHGSPGTGKSFYIKHLTAISDREFIFIPVNMADQLGSPEFISLLMNKKESVLILEDAEQAVQSRESGNLSAVSTLLNLADGILGSFLNITIIVTYNADRQHIDKALLRKGRLMFDYYFGELSAKDANRLGEHLKKDLKAKEPMSLADIYGIEDDINYSPAETQRQMGFHVTQKTS